MLLEGVIANTVTYNTLIHAFLRRGAIQEALKLANDMLFRGCPLDEITYNGLIKALCKAGAIDKGLALFEEMMRKGVVPSNISCNILINGLCRTGKVNTALEFLRDMIHRGLTPDIVTYNSLINVGTSHMLRIGDSKGTFRKWLLSLTLLLSLCASINLWVGFILNILEFLKYGLEANFHPSVIPHAYRLSFTSLEDTYLFKAMFLSWFSLPNL
ncbi:hypothetical protein Patl1_09697 [Pistacia atlantica]|uniref:Uncharacterized protein n=1 Tax=Pistacia atlantica TaxID=434234 RepID=A0ACC1A6Q9_9ROSI|nr:hypothetical protein Patl1_09697 [Pistacia atlantica]